eukprot:3706653-Prymnesium_polylepis.1
MSRDPRGMQLSRGALSQSKSRLHVESRIVHAEDAVAKLDAPKLCVGERARRIERVHPPAALLELTHNGPIGSGRSSSFARQRRPADLLSEEEVVEAKVDTPGTPRQQLHCLGRVQKPIPGAVTAHAWILGAVDVDVHHVEDARHAVLLEHRGERHRRCHRPWPRLCAGGGGCTAPEELLVPPHSAVAFANCLVESHVERYAVSPQVAGGLAPACNVAIVEVDGFDSQ